MDSEGIMQEFIRGTGIVCLYYALAASTAFVSRKLIRIPDELFRKILHFILQISYIFIAYAFETWWLSVLFGFLIVAIAFPIFTLLGHTAGFSSFVNERKAGEFRISLILAFVMLGICNSICWGLLGDKYLGLACMYAWGIGDGFAALVGKKYGKHKLTWKFADRKKSLEGSLAMFITSALSVAAVLLLHGHASALACILVPVASAGVATYVESITPNGMDTVTCPAAAMAVTLPLMYVLGGLG
jgi:dolichol kinase